MRRLTSLALIAFGTLWLLAPSTPFCVAQERSTELSSTGDPDEVRPYDLVRIKTGAVIEGFILTPGDLRSVEKFRMRRRSGSTLSLNVDDVENIVRRQPPEMVYEHKVRGLRRISGEREFLDALIDLARWCHAPLVVLEGDPPLPERAVEHYLRALELDPSQHEVYPHVLSLLASESSVDEILVQSLSDEPRSLSAAAASRLEHEARVIELAAQGGYESPELDYRAGLIAALWLESASGAIGHLTRFLDKDSTNLGQRRRARALLSRLRREAGDVAGAQKVYEDLLKTERGRDSFEAHFELGMLAFESEAADALQQSRTHFQAALEAQPRYSPLLLYLAAVEYEAGDLTAAQRWLRRFRAQAPDDIDGACDLAIVLEGSGKSAAARKLLSELPSSTGGRLELTRAALLDAAGDQESALVHYRNAAAGAESAAARLALANVLARLGQVGEAKSLAAAELKRGESSTFFAVASHILASCALSGRDEETARGHLERAVRLQPNGDWLEQLGVVCLQQGDLAAGRAHLGRLSDVKERPHALAALGYYHYSLGEFDQADQLFEQVVRLITPKKPGGKNLSKSRRAVLDYAISGRQAIADLHSLEVWRAKLHSDPSDHVDGWQESERFGVAIGSHPAGMRFHGVQRGEPDGVTSAFSDRSFSVDRFERVVTRLRIVRGKVRIGLRLEEIAARRRGGGFLVSRDYDGRVRLLQKARNTWQEMEPSEPADKRDSDALFEYRGDFIWPEGANTHTLEIRVARERQVDRRGARTGVRRAHVFLDGRAVAKYVDIDEIEGDMRIGVSAQADAIGASYDVIVESFDVYRRRPVEVRNERY